MRKQVRRHGRLIQKVQKNVLRVNDVRQRQAAPGMFRIIATSGDLQNAWIEGNYETLREARVVVDEFPISDVSYYIHSDSSRVLHIRKGIVDA